MIRNFLLATILTFIALHGFSQTSCEYRIEMYDNFGDGWNNASLEITSNSINYSATLLDGDFDEFSFEVTNGAPFSIDFVMGDFDNEISFIVFNSDNDVIFVGTASVDEIQHDGIQIFQQIGSSDVMLVFDTPTPFEVTVIDMVGKIVYTSKNEASKSHKISLEHVSQGQYALVVSNNQSHVTKLVVR